MSLPIYFCALAKAEYDIAAAWYDEARSGLGIDFEAEVQAVLDELSEHPSRYPIADGDVREAPLIGFLTVSTIECARTKL